MNNPNARLTHCKRGHPLSGDNLRIRTRTDGSKWRSCIACARLYCDQHNLRRRQTVRSVAKVKQAAGLPYFGESIAELLDRMTIPVPESGCWLWTGAIDSHGYGKLKRRRKIITAHREAWRLHKGEIPNGMFVCHKCDTRACANPDHLFLGTHQDNMDDMKRKGRARSGRKSRPLLGPK